MYRTDKTHAFEAGGACEVNVRRTGLTDEAFQTLVHVLQQSPSLHTLDLSDNELSMTSVRGSPCLGLLKKVSAYFTMKIST